MFTQHKEVRLHFPINYKFTETLLHSVQLANFVSYALDGRNLFLQEFMFQNMRQLKSQKNKMDIANNKCCHGTHLL